MNIGYPCINNGLAAQGIRTNRVMTKRTLETKGINHAGWLAEQNLQDLLKVLQWNVENNIHVFRMSSDLFPWMSHYKFEDLYNFSEIHALLNDIGDYILDNSLRVSFHPGQFNCLASTNLAIVENSINDLDQHSRIMDLMGLPETPFYKINIHIGGAYGDKQSAMHRFCNRFQQLQESTKKRLTIENDDKPNMFTVSDLMWLHNMLEIPIVFDYHHYDCNPGNISKQKSLELALSTWKTVKPIVHVSSSRREYEDNSAKVVSHADYIYERIDTFGHNFDIMLEAKAKEQAVFSYIEQFIYG